MSLERAANRVTGWVLALALAGCAVDDAELSEREGTEAEAELEGTSQALGSFSHVLPKRGGSHAIIESQFHGFGMLYSMQLRTGVLVDAVSTSFYTPTNPNNQFTAGDPTFARGPAGGTAGSPAPALTCPSGFAAQGLYGRSGGRLDMLGLVCTQIGSDGKPIESAQRAIGAYGGSGGTFFYDVCAGTWLAGINLEIALKSSGTNKIVSSVQGYCANAR